MPEMPAFLANLLVPSLARPATVVAVDDVAPSLLVVRFAGKALQGVQARALKRNEPLAPVKLSPRSTEQRKRGEQERGPPRATRQTEQGTRAGGVAGADGFCIRASAPAARAGGGQRGSSSEL